MIQQLRVKNYKRFKGDFNPETGEQDFVTFNFGKRLTMIYGPNSSGKSSVLRAMQILRQAWEYDHFLYLRPTGEKTSFFPL